MTSAVFTLLYSSEYLPGCLLLGKVLRKLLRDGGYDNIETGVLIDTKGFQENELSLIKSIYDVLLPIEPIESDMKRKLSESLKRPELGKTFSKIYLWALTQYDKVLYMDSDMLPIQEDAESSVIDLLSLDFETGKVLASPDSGFPDIFNSGLMLFHPSYDDFLNLLSASQTASATDASFDGADQGLLNQFFNSKPNWVAEVLNQGQGKVRRADELRSSRWIPLPFLYNVTSSTLYQYLPAYNYFSNVPTDHESNRVNVSHGPENTTSSSTTALEDYARSAYAYFSTGCTQVKVFHFIGPNKPWRVSSEEGMHKTWWDTWNSFFEGKTLGQLKEEQVNYTPLPLINLDKDEDFISLEKSEQKSEQEILCDPSTYQNFTSGVSATADSSWDATKEAPPAPCSDRPVEALFPSYSNAWDEKTSELHDETQSMEEQNEIISSLDDTFGYYASQRPERSFRPHTDYTIEHPLDRISLQSKRIASEKNQNNANEDLNTVEANIQELEISEDQEIHPNLKVESPKDELQFIDSIPPSKEIPKLFPWEFRDKTFEAERTFQL